MHISLISGSMKKDGGQSTRIANIISDQLKEQGHTTHIVEARNLPLWDESMWGSDGDTAKIWQTMQPDLQKSDAFILLAPEYNGTAPAALKNFLHCLSGKEAAHKPALLIAVSAGQNGSYPIAELRATASKNNKLVFIPDHLIIRNAETALTEKGDPITQERLTYSLNVLTQYAEAMKPLYKIQTPDAYKFGM